MNIMINLTLGDISLKSIGSSSGFFVGQKNTHKKFHQVQVINEVVGTVAGNENIIIDNYWSKNDKSEEVE